MRLATELDLLGYSGDVRTCEDQIYRVYLEMFPNESEEEILFHPNEKGIPFVHRVREVMGLDLKEDSILKVPTRLRKTKRRHGIDPMNN